MEEGVDIHDFAAGILAEMGFCAGPIRTILVQKGYFAGYKYRFEGGYALWLFEKNAIEVYEDAGQLLKTVCWLVKVRVPAAFG